MDCFDKDKTKRRKIDKNTRDAVWLKYMGNKAEGKCYCCQIRTIHITDFQVGHNKAFAKGGNDDIGNLRPICGPCNRGMGTMSIEKYKQKYFKDPVASTTKKPDKKEPIKSETTISKKDILNKLPITKLKKIVKELDLKYNELWDGDEKEDYIKFLSSSRKATVKRIQEVITTKKPDKKEPIKSKTTITKKDLLNKLPITKLKKIVKELDLEYNELWDGDEKEDYIKFLSRSRKATVKKIQEVVE
ncbi:MAG: HNH endonuclease signature motif containing protein [Clostridia bacterium]|nr:HNH endonuclease signature motif containing protein [Clostridia bacterium]